MASAGFVNICCDVNDKFYCFRMPLFLTNMKDVARALYRLSTYLTKFFSCKPDVVRVFKACAKGTGVDVKHKLVIFILKNPRKSKKGVKGKTNGTGGGVHASAPLVPGDKIGSMSGDDSDDELTKKIKAENQTCSSSTNISRGAVKARVKRLDSQVSGLSHTPPAGGSGDDDVNCPYTQFGCLVEQNKSEADIGAMHIYQRAQEFGVEEKHKTALVLGAKEIDLYKALPAKTALLGGIESLVGLTHPKLIPFIDILKEDVLTQWGTHVSRKYIDKETSKKARNASESFLKWLKEADDDNAQCMIWRPRSYFHFYIFLLPCFSPFGRQGFKVLIIVQ
ncbi:uncharacterized protein BJ212DRAFT_1568673 [Suillus subaureus]|uniref:W2 domain-containing protein n=1 Tax=Suillus subaureus TaxID=48587 RepID=A0A9P7JD09_9AGAM|nr:uncharacterized protein BJ212DRAFT_1568673 [Suillus subaureus]KAG1816010.1 hypothetical protein BJ212DRAFT_1568673 [Suillus subaureus]